jgi:alanyl-tRNA synthetase
MREELHASHHYEYKNNDTKCWVCGQSFYEKALTRCSGFKSEKKACSIENVILDEEASYARTLEKCHLLVLKRFTKPEDVTSENLAELYHTYGCDSSIVEEVLNCRLPESIHTGFMLLMDKERARSKAAQIKQIITVKGIDL